MQPDRVDPVTLARLRLQRCRQLHPVAYRPARPFVEAPRLRQPDEGETALSVDEVAWGIGLGLIRAE